MIALFYTLAAAVERRTRHARKTVVAITVKNLSCTIYCLCTTGDECCNPFTKKEEMEENDDQYDHEYDDSYVDRDEL